MSLSFVARVARFSGRWQASIAKLATDASDCRGFVLGFIAVHALLWTVILTLLKAAQDIHFDVAEAFGWGQSYLLGYGKHPPLSGWVAGLWFSVFPTTDWATYALAMTVVGVGMLICWMIALRVVDRRRAFFVLVMLALYPIFNFKGFKYNPDLLQLVTLPLVVLAYLDAFDKRTVRSGVWLGIACALALLTKYWALTMIGAIGIAALVHPARTAFLRSPAPWVAIVAMAVAMVPHVAWLAQVDFLPLSYAEDTYALSTRAEALTFVRGYIAHNIALLAVPLVLSAVVLVWGRWRSVLIADPTSCAGARLARPDMRRAQAINVWIIQAVVAIGPPLGAIAFAVHIKTDWGISLFFLVPLCLMAIPALPVQRVALPKILSVWLMISLLTLAASPLIASYTMPRKSAADYRTGARSELAADLTAAWHRRFHRRWSIVVGTTAIGQPMTFYSPDHPTTLSPNEKWPSGLASPAAARALGFVGICDPNDDRFQSCEAWMRSHAGGAEHIVMPTHRVFRGRVGPRTDWSVYFVSPQAADSP
ncbi:glycosyltransferase family 39 protein [Rhodopseudomonas palustris]|uniref:glycosyltransferase family 39 protein n=1 Tax=Rhodopseudomonas palustris TaxID=1076 RepID=UPI0039F5A584